MLVGGIEELAFSSFELESSLLAVFVHVLKIFGVCRNPDMFDIRVYGTERVFTEILVRDIGKADSPRGDATSHTRRQKVCLTNVDVEKSLSCNHEHDKPKEDPGDEDSSVVAVGLVADIRQ